MGKVGNSTTPGSNSDLYITALKSVLSKLSWMMQCD